MNSIFVELKRRNVIKMALAYIAVGWLLVSIGDVALPLIDAPDWVFKSLILVIALGLPIVVIFAWIFELTPDGLRLEKDVDPAESIALETGRKLNIAFIAVLIAALGVSVYINISGTPAPERINNVSDVGDTQHSIAVLPFSNRSIDPQNAVFVDGIHDDLLTSLAHISDLKVISRTSVMEYRDTTKNLREIAEELSVTKILQGTVQRIGDNVRINVALIDAQTDDHLWVDTYDRELNTKNIFEIQSEISTRISEALQTKLTPRQRDRIDIVPTQNMDAYRLYRLGRHNLAERQFETATLARTQFEQAIELDPLYSDAYSGLADSILLLRINHNAITPEEAYPLAQEALNEALSLNPDHADAYASLGLLKLDIWQQTRSGPEIDEAEAAFETALELNPNNAQAVMWYASLKAARLDLDKAIDLYHRSLELDPLGRIPYANLPGLYALMGRNQDALDAWLEAVRLHPGWPTPYQNIANHLQGLGRIDESIAWHMKASELDTDPLSDGNVLGAYLAFGETQRALDFLGGIPLDHPLSPLVPLFQAFISGDFAGSVDAIDGMLLEGAHPPAFALDIASDAALIIDDLDKAREFVYLMQPDLEDDPLAALDHLNAGHVLKLGYIAARQGDEEQARELLSASLEVTRQRPRLGMAGHGINDVQIHAIQGEYNLALARLRDAIDAGYRSAQTYDNWSLTQDPYLAGLRDDPRFKEMHEEMLAKRELLHRRAQQAESNDNWQALRTLAMEVPVNPAASITSQ